MTRAAEFIGPIQDVQNEGADNCSAPGTGPGVHPGQFKTGKLGGCDATMTELWNAALAA